MSDTRERDIAEYTNTETQESLKQRFVNWLGNVTVENSLRYSLAVATGASVAAVSAAIAPGSEAKQQSLKRAMPKLIGVVEDKVRAKSFDDAFHEMKRLADEVNTGAVRVTAVWVEGQTRPSDSDLEALKNASEAAKSRDMEVILSVYPCSFRECPKNISPTNTWERGKFSNWLASLAYELPDIKYFIVGNELNSSDFWRPQFRADGADAAAASYYKLLAWSYDVLEKAATGRGNEIIVGGGATSSTGTQPTETFIKNLGKAYRSNGRTQPIMDFYVHHPYPENSSERPSTVHSSNTIGIADYERLVKALGNAFDGTGQRGSTLPILYGEFGIETKIPSEKKHLYKGLERSSTQPVDELVQAAYFEEALGLVACQPNVIGMLNFLAYDEEDLSRWQSGLYYRDGTPKSSLKRLQKRILAARTGTIECFQTLDTKK